MLIEVYSDGSGNTFASDGGYGWRILIDGAFHSEGSGYLPSATNNVAEITAAISGLEEVRSIIATLLSNTICREDIKVTLISDSQLVLGYASGKYQCKALHLAPLYIQVRALYKELNVEVKWQKGHAGEPNNEACDQLAKAARESKGIIKI